MKNFKNLFNTISKYSQKGLALPLLVLFLFVATIYQPFFIKGLLPIPSDTIVGLYHPWRDFYASDYPNGIPYKNFLITDAVRQLYPWRQLAINEFAKGEAPLWNPYNFAGMPLAANLQTAAYYPLNLLYAFLNFPLAWSIQVILQTILGGIFMMFFLRKLRLAPSAIAMGMLAWVGSGFFVAWLTSNTLDQVAIWLPLLFLGVEETREKTKRMWLAPLLIAVAVCCSFLAGALQIFGYALLAMICYSIYVAVSVRSVRPILLTLVGTAVGLLIAFPQWRLLIEFSTQSIRSLGPLAWQRAGYFIPPLQLAQFLAPDYFGNPATLNYFGIWNYMEFIGYVGIIPIILAVIAIGINHKRSLFWAILIITSLVLATQNLIAELPFRLSIPFLNLAQPTRLLVIVDFALAVLAAIGLNTLLNKATLNKNILFALGKITLIFIGLWVFALSKEILISRNNLIIPSALFMLGTVLIITYIKKPSQIIVIALLLLTIFDLSRFFGKFEPFTDRQLLYPQTKITQYLSDQQKIAPIRVAALDDRIIPPNFSIVHKIPMVSGYDSFFLKRYADLLSRIEGVTDFNRIIVPKNISHPLFPLLGVNYILSYGPNSAKELALLMQEGETYLYQVQRPLKRAFFISELKLPGEDFDPNSQAVVENYQGKKQYESNNNVITITYSENSVTMSVYAPEDGFLVLLDSYYPSWHATIDGNPATIYPTDYAFRGVFVPAKSQQIVFTIK